MNFTMVFETPNPNFEGIQESSLGVVSKLEEHQLTLEQDISTQSTQLDCLFWCFSSLAIPNLGGGFQSSM